MYQIRSRQIARLEKRASTYIKQRVGIEEQWRNVRRGVVAHATVLAFLVRYGNLRMDEPLSYACQRVTESQAWKACRDKIPPFYKYVHHEKLFEPYSRSSVMVIGEPLRHVVISSFPGIDERAKLNAVFKSAPPWFIWFTFADYTAALLGLKIPDLSSVKQFARSRDAFDRWWGLPKNAFERDPWPQGEESDLARTDLSLLRPEPAHDELMSRRERKRVLATSTNWTDEWPAPYPLEFFQMDIRSVMAQSGVPGFAKDKRHLKFCGNDMSPAMRWRGSGGYR
jgi:hypothetical protein